MRKSKRNKMSDLFNIHEWEVKGAILITIIFVIFFWYINFYEEFFFYETIVKDLIIEILGAYIGLLGFSLSGIAIIVSLFSKKEIALINEINKKETTTLILESYGFLAKNIGIECFILIMFYFLISSKRPLVNIWFFYVIIAIEIYYIAFIIFYTVALVGNCIELYKIKNIYHEIEVTEKTIHDIVSEVKIDYIFSTLVNIHSYTTEEIVSNLVLFVQESSVNNKDAIIDYIKKQYSSEQKETTP